MILPGHARKLGCSAALLLASVAGAQAGLPATAPTGVSQLPSANPPISPSSRRVPTHLAVVWDGVSLQVDASNASLNAVLHEIGQKTHMSITGSAPDERMFGTYGPGPLNLVVPALLNGVAVNLLLTERQGGAADELLLTNREGGATPSYIPTQQDADGNTAAPAANPANGQVVRRGPGVRGNTGLPPNGNDPVIPDNGISGRDNGISGPNNGVNGADNGVSGRDNGVNGTDNGLNNSNAAANAAATSNSVPTTDGSTTASPNGVRTPQEIFEQLQRLRQQQTPQ